MSFQLVDTDGRVWLEIDSETRSALDVVLKRYKPMDEFTRKVLEALGRQAIADSQSALFFKLVEAYRMLTKCIKYTDVALIREQYELVEPRMYMPNDGYARKNLVLKGD